MARLQEEQANLDNDIPLRPGIPIIFGGRRMIDITHMDILDGIFLFNNNFGNQPPESQGLTQEQIMELMPMHLYEKQQEIRIDIPDGGDNPQENEDCCTICLESFEPRQEVRTTPCSHTFHVACIDSWLEIRNVCPNCKQELGTSNSHPHHPPGDFHPLAEIHSNEMLDVPDSSNIDQ